MVSNRGPSAYQPNALPLGQTGSQIRSKDTAWTNADIRWAIKQGYWLFKKAKRSNKDEN